MTTSDATDDLFLVTTPNGVFDVRDGTFVQHPEGTIPAAATAVSFRDDTECPEWESFVRWALRDDPAWVQFIQRAVGSSLTGSTRDGLCFLLHGQGPSGKSTFLKTLLEVVGDYGRRAGVGDTLLPLDGLESVLPTEVLMAELEGGRFLWTVSGRPRPVAAAIKTLVAGEPAVARRPSEERRLITPTVKLWVESNVGPNDYHRSIFLRIVPIPFLRIPEARDPHLCEKFLDEREGILRWCLEGARLWYRDGLRVPTESPRLALH